MFKIAVILSFLYISSINCISNSTLESMKQGISPFNKAGNMFFNLIRGNFDSSSINIDEYLNLTLSIESMKKVASNYLSHSILFATGVVFAVLLPIVGLFLCFCRYCGRCGGRRKSMDPKNVKCKKVAYSICLTTLTVIMIFAVIITLFNNQLVHESVVNSDPSINIFLRVKYQFEKIQTNLETMKSEIIKAPPSQIDNENMQQTFKELEGAIKKFFDNLMNVSEVLNLIDQSKIIKQVIGPEEVSNFHNYTKNLNHRFKNLNDTLSQVKANISTKLSPCLSNQCRDIKDKIDSFKINSIDESQIKKIIDLLDSLISTNFQERLNKIINLNTNGITDLKLVLDSEVKNFKYIINNQTLTDNTKKILVQLIDRSLNIVKLASENTPSPLKNQLNSSISFRTAKSIEQYRYYIYLGLSIGIVLIVIFYFLGLLFGNCGERPEEDAGCFNRGVGANFLLISVVITFLFSSLLMITVLSNLLTTNIVQTDFCRYFTNSAKDTPQNYKLLDQYLTLSLKLAGGQSNYSTDGLMEGLFGKCQIKNFYEAFQKMTEKYKSLVLRTQFESIDKVIVSNLDNKLNLTEYITTDPFADLSNFDQLINSVSLSISNESMTKLLNELKSAPVDLSSEIDSIKSIVANISQIRQILQTILQSLTNIQNHYTQWKLRAQIFNNNLVVIIKSQSPIVLYSIEKNISELLNLLFGTMFSKVSCADVRNNFIDILKFSCENVIDPMNGCWYGLGVFLLLAIPSMVFALLLISLYRRIQKFYPDREEPDYENYIGFYARADGDAAKKNPANQGKPPHRGYKPIPLQ